MKFIQRDLEDCGVSIGRTQVVRRDKAHYQRWAVKGGLLVLVVHWSSAARGAYIAIVLEGVTSCVKSQCLSIATIMRGREGGRCQEPGIVSMGDC